MSMRLLFMSAEMKWTDIILYILLNQSQNQCYLPLSHLRAIQSMIFNLSFEMWNDSWAFFTIKHFRYFTIRMLVLISNIEHTFHRFHMWDYGQRCVSNVTKKNYRPLNILCSENIPKYLGFLAFFSLSFYEQNGKIDVKTRTRLESKQKT